MDEPQPAIPASRANPQVQDVLRRVVDAFQELRARTMVRTSSAMVRWILLVVAVGAGVALLVAFAVTLLVSQLPGGG